MAAIEETRAKLRALMPIAEKCAYFDHAAMCALPQPTADAFQQWLTEAIEVGGPVWGQWVRGVEAARKTAAKMIGAQPTEIAFVSNTTSGISLVAEGLDWCEGDTVVTFADEFPS